MPILSGDRVGIQFVGKDPQCDASINVNRTHGSLTIFIMYIPNDLTVFNNVTVR